MLGTLLRQRICSLRLLCVAEGLLCQYGTVEVWHMLGGFAEGLMSGLLRPGFRLAESELTVFHSLQGIVTVGDYDGVVAQVHIPSGHLLADVDEYMGRRYAFLL